VASGHEAAPPEHLTAFCAATCFKPFFRVVHPAVAHVATAEQQSSAGSLLAVPNGVVPSFVVSLYLSVPQATLSALHFRGSSMQHSFCTQLAGSDVLHVPHFDIFWGAAHPALAT